MYKVTYPIWRVGAIVGLPITLLAEGWGGDDAVWPSARLAHVAELGPRFISICFSFGFSKVSRFGVPGEEFHALAVIEIARVGTAANIVCSLRPPPPPPHAAAAEKQPRRRQFLPFSMDLLVDASKKGRGIQVVYGSTSYSHLMDAEGDTSNYDGHQRSLGGSPLFSDHNYVC